MPRCALTIQQKIDTVQRLVLSRIARLTSILVHEPDNVEITPKTKSGAVPAATPSAEPQKPIPVEVHQPDLTAIELAQRIVTPVVDPLSTTAIVLIVSIFILQHREDLRDRMIRLDVPVLVGLWPDGEEILHDERLRTAVGADYYTSSLHAAVEACLEVAHKAAVDEQPPRMTVAVE